MAILLLMNCEHIYGYSNSRSYIVELSPETGKPLGPAARIGFDPDITAKNVQGDDKKWRRKDAGKTLALCSAPTLPTTYLCLLSAEGHHLARLFLSSCPRLEF